MHICQIKVCSGVAPWASTIKLFSDHQTDLSNFSKKSNFLCCFLAWRKTSEKHFGKCEEKSFIVLAPGQSVKAGDLWIVRFRVR